MDVAIETAWEKGNVLVVEVVGRQEGGTAATTVRVRVRVRVRTNVKEREREKTRGRRMVK